MATLIKEDGTGKADANSYADLAEADAYFEARLHSSLWTEGVEDENARALIFATLLIDALFRFEGWKRTAEQARQWPRLRCPDAEHSGGSKFLPDNTVPVCLREATCELARFLLAEDRTGDAEGIGLRSLSIEGALKMVFDPARPKPVVPEFVQAMLARVGTYRGRRCGSVPLIRV
jgi:hypothetical protein